MKDDEWALAGAVEVFANLADPDPKHLGVVIARRCATGWFLSAHHRPGLDPDEIEHFAEFARVRAYLLLTQGPTVHTWTPGSGFDDWLAWSGRDEFDVAELVPDAVPADWR
jgi:hypothetical protein